MNASSPNPYEPPVTRRWATANPLSHGEKLIVLATFTNSTAAHLFQFELAEQGIDSSLANELTTALFGATPFGPTSAFAIEVLVRESDGDKAHEIKSAWLDSTNHEVSEIPEWVCLCGETVDAGYSVCWNCEAAYDKASNHPNVPG